MKRFIFPVLVTLCLVAFVADRAPVAAKDKWISLRTKNFFVMGNTGEKELRQVATKLEQFREAFTVLFPKIRFNTSVPTTVIVFKSRDSYAPFRPNSNTAGYFQPGEDVNYITLTTQAGNNDPFAVKLSGSQDAFTVIFHEYTHLLVNNTFKKAPVWFNEGLAEYNSTFKITEDQQFALGTAIGNHVFLLRDSKLLPFKTLFAVDHQSPYYNESKKQGIFYAQSWALIHYLLIGTSGKVDQLARFLDLTTTNLPVEQAFQQAFEMPMEAMEKALRNYVKQDSYHVLNGHFKNKLELDANAQLTTLTEAEAQAYLGDLLLHSNRADAITYLENALKLDPNLAMAHASLGMLYFRQGKVAEARASLERAVAANSQNYLAHYYYAFALSRFSPDESTPVSAYTPEMLAKIREHLQKAIALRPDFLEPYNLLAFVSLVTGENVKESIASLKQALTVSPGRHDFTFTLAQLYMRDRDYKTSRQLLEQIVKSDAQEHLRKNAEAMLGTLTTMEEQLAHYEQMKKTNAAAADAAPNLIPNTPITITSSVPSQPGRPRTGPAPIPAPTPATDPSAYLREVLRTPATGESQLQGTLLRLECDAKGIVFVVQTEAGMQRFRAATFDDVEITTYDTSVKGDITCGERKPTNTVVVVYVPNTDKRIKADGIIKSIEFVPAEFKLKPAP